MVPVHCIMITLLECYLSSGPALLGRVKRSALWAGSYTMLFSRYFLCASLSGLSFSSRTCWADSTLKHLGTCTPTCTRDRSQFRKKRKRLHLGDKPGIVPGCPGKVQGPHTHGKNNAHVPYHIRNHTYTENSFGLIIIPYGEGGGGRSMI